MERLGETLRRIGARRQELISEQLAKLDAAKREAWAGWRRSQRNAVRVTTRTTRKGEVRIETRTTRAGDPRFLRVVSDCVHRTCLLLDLYGPDQAAATLPGGAEIGVIEVQPREQTAKALRVKDVRHRTDLGTERCVVQVRKAELPLRPLDHVGRPHEPREKRLAETHQRAAEAEARSVMAA